MGSQIQFSRLVLHIDSLQEGFELLSRATTVREMGTRLFQLVRGSLTTVEGCVAFRPHGENAWQILHRKGTVAEQDVSFPEEVNGFSLNVNKGRLLPVLALQPLLDGSSLALALGHKLAKRSPYTQHDRIALRILLQLFANAYQSHLHRLREKQLVFSLNHRVLQLNSLIDTGIALSRTRQDRTLYRLAIEQAAALTNASQGSVTIATGRSLVERISFPEGSRPPRGIPANQRIRASFKFLGQTHTFELTGKESRQGVVPFEETDRLLLESLARQVHAARESHYLHAQEIEKQKIERDITVAASIQQRILPKSLPAIPEYDLSGINIPTKLVGGDYYDCIPLADGRYALVMADVAGKGVPAALLVSSFHAYLSAYLESRVTLVDLAKRLNTVIYRASTEERYITAILALFNPATGELESINAGHTPMYLLRKEGTFVELGRGGLALGMMDMDFPYETDSVVLERGDRLLLFTDGVSEAMNAAGNLYDTDGALRDLVVRHRPGRSEQFIRALILDIQRFVGPAPQADDITALYLMRTPVDFQDGSQ
jgi:sigma-B regulation protein RsbU (phosphoserine phosphatase)